MGLPCVVLRVRRASSSLSAASAGDFMRRWMRDTMHGVYDSELSRVL
jgi:hypothetical protein